MAITEDASAPPVITLTGAGTPTTAAFSPPALSLVLVIVGGGWNSAGSTDVTIADSGTHTWTLGASAQGTVANRNGIAKLYYCYFVSAPGSITITATYTGLQGGRLLDVRVLNGAGASQSGAGSGSNVISTAATTGTVSVTTTVANSRVYGLADNPDGNTAYTANGLTSLLTDYADATDGIRLVSWKAASATGTPGATTLGGTWAASQRSNIAAVEILPFVSTTVAPTAATGTGTANNATITSTSPTAHPVAASAVGTAGSPIVLNPGVVTATFPTTPRVVPVELFLNGQWVDVSTDLRAVRDVVITRGRRNEASQVEPSTCQLEFDNRSGNYSPRNPNGIYWGSLGRNTPIRLSVQLAVDTFTRGVASGWGTSDTGQVWTSGGIGGTVAGTDQQVSLGKGKHSVPATNAFRYTSLAPNYGDVDVKVTVTMALTSVTGGEVYPANILLRGQAAGDYYRVRVAFTSTGDLTLGLYHADGTALAAPVTVFTAVYAPGTPFFVRAQIEGNTLRAKVWYSTEPYGWQVTAHDTRMTAAGWVGIRSGVAAGNTNTLPIVFTYDNVIVRSPRFAGEISSLQQRWDETGNNSYSPATAAGISRRLGQGASLTEATLHRAITRLATPAVAYWPCEDGALATSIASGIAGGTPMSVIGSTTFSSYTGIASSGPLPVLDATGTWVGAVPSYSSSGGAAQLRFVLHAPAADLSNGMIIADLHTTTGQEWSVIYHTGGYLALDMWWNGTAHWVFGVWIPAGVQNTPVLVSVELVEFGADGVTSTLQAMKIGQTAAVSATDNTHVGMRIGSVDRVRIGQGNIAGCAVGHINLRGEITPITDMVNDLNAFAGETAGARISRLCAQEGIPFSYVGDLTSTALMGPQRMITMLGSLAEAADADLGTLCDSRGETGLTYRTRSSVYSQTPTMTLNYAAQHVSAPFEPEDDDIHTRNDVTVTRTNGSSATRTLNTGRLSILAASAGGVGRYTDSLTLNVYADTQLPDIAAWLVHRDTVDETRYPTVKVALANSAISADPVLSVAVLDLDVDDRFDITGQPAIQTPETVSQIARGYTEQLNLFEHSVVINAAPESPYRVVVMDSARFAPSAATLTSTITSTAATLAVSTPAGRALWTTNGAFMPFTIRIGGEVITVTAISGSSSPQTFTVTRSANGVVAAHSAGAAVTLATAVAVPL
jgi:hypothetical protein